MRESGFSITQDFHPEHATGKGFQITFANGWTVSVQFGPGNYADNHGESFSDLGPKDGRKSSRAETAFIAPQGTLQPFPDGDTVQGYQTPEQVLALMMKVATR